jgi:hypothetical protein
MPKGRGRGVGERSDHARSAYDLGRNREWIKEWRLVSTSRNPRLLKPVPDVQP